MEVKPYETGILGSADDNDNAERPAWRHQKLHSRTASYREFGTGILEACAESNAG